MDTEEGSEGVGRVLLGSSHCTWRVVLLALHRNLAQWRAVGETDAKMRDCEGRHCCGSLWTGWRRRGRTIFVLPAAYAAAIDSDSRRPRWALGRVPAWR